MNDPKILETRRIGPRNRFEVTKFLTRFGEIEYFVRDMEKIDQDGYHPIIGQGSSVQNILDYMKKGENLDVMG